MFSFKNDLKIIIDVLNISAMDLANDLGFDVPTISNWLNGKYEPDFRSKEDVYEYAYKSGLRINDAHIKPLNRLAKKQGFRVLYHGSKNGISGDIDLNYSKRNNDLGVGFYLGETIEQSAMFVSDYKSSHVYSYGLYPMGLKIYEFNTDLDWLLFVAHNRGRLAKEINSKIVNKILDDTKDVDVIISPIADNRMFAIIDEFLEGMITDEACLFAIAALNLGRQFCLKTPKAISNLYEIREFYICQTEKEYFQKMNNKLQKDRYENIKDFRSKNRNGKYIEELL